MVQNDINSLKICDFGLASKVGVGFYDQNTEKVGTLIYQPPEQMGNSYGKSVDIWATGIIIYEMITKGGHPIIGENSLSLEEYK